jgi:hypothetical protein
VIGPLWARLYVANEGNCIIPTVCLSYIDIVHQKVENCIKLTIYL